MAPGQAYESSPVTEESDRVNVSPGFFYPKYYHVRPEEVMGDRYSPDGAILIGQSGDLWFNITVVDVRGGVRVLIPPDFTGFWESLEAPGIVDTSNILTNITADYGDISVVQLDERDPNGPLWWDLRVLGLLNPDTHYFVRVKGMNSPEVAGRFFFKVFTYHLLEGWVSINPFYYPTLLVKAGVDPAYVEGQIRIGSQYGYGEPIDAPGKVVAEGKTPDGRLVTAQAYFNQSDRGHYILDGLAEGTYNISAYAAGYEPTTLSRSVTVLKGQSLRGVNVYLIPGAVLEGRVHSKSAIGPVNWSAPRPITIEVLDEDGKLLAFTPSPSAPTEFVDLNTSTYNFSLGGAVEYSGYIPGQAEAGYVSGLNAGIYYLKAYVNQYVQDEAKLVIVPSVQYPGRIYVEFDLWRGGYFNVEVYFKSAFGGAAPIPSDRLLVIEAYDSVTNEFRGFNFTTVRTGDVNVSLFVNGLGMAGPDLDGKKYSLYRYRLLRDYGLIEGTYYFKVYVKGYMQQYPFPKGSTTLSADASSKLSLDLLKGSALELTVRSRGVGDPAAPVNWLYSGAPVDVAIYDSAYGVVGTFSMEQDPAKNCVSGYFEGNEYGLDEAFMKGVLWSSEFYPTSLTGGTYTIKVYTVGYLQDGEVFFTAIAGASVDLTLDVFIGARLALTLIFEKENIFAPPEARYVRAELRGLDERLVAATIDTLGTESVKVVSLFGFLDYYTVHAGHMWDYGLPNGSYWVDVYVTGYLQTERVMVNVTSGSLFSLTICLHRMAHVEGNVYGYDWLGDLKLLSWADVKIGDVSTPTLDGFYGTYLETGVYNATASSTGYESQVVATSVSVEHASELTLNFLLSRSEASIPEFPMGPSIALLLSILVVAEIRHLRFHLMHSARLRTFTRQPASYRDFSGYFESNQFHQLLKDFSTGMN